MSIPFGQFSFAAGELSPALYGHIDLAKFHIGLSTARNGFVNYRGGFNSRAGTAFTGYSKQTGRAYPPRLVTFQFNINQGLALEFGDHYMRVIQNGAFVTETPFNVAGVTKADPAVLTVSGAGGIATAAPVNTGVVDSYAPGDTITVAGGSYVTPGVLSVTDTLLLSTALLSAGNASSSVYAPGDTITLNPTGGTPSTNPIITIVTTQVIGATIAAAGSGGTNGTQTVVGTTGTGTKFQASVTVAGGIITAIGAITISGDYTANPTVPSAEPVTGASLSGAELDLAIGVRTFTITTSGVLTLNGDGTFSQSATSGSGLGATFQNGLFAPHALGVATAGVYSALPTNPAAQASSSGVGQGAAFNLTATGTAAPFVNGDWVFLTGLGGMVELNGGAYVATGVSGSTIELYDVFGVAVDSTLFGTYTSGGTAARIYTLTTPWAEADLPWLKWTQSADVTTFCCWNQVTGTSYPAYNLVRKANNLWTLSPVTVAPYLGKTGAVAVTASASGTQYYGYAITAIDLMTGQEGPPVFSGSVGGFVDIATTLGSITVKWDAVDGASSYNVYKATSVYNEAIPTGAQYGYAAAVAGQSWVDGNTVPDFSQSPPLFHDPFAPGQVLYCMLQSNGAGITSCSVSITSGTGSGFVGQAIIDPANQYVTGVLIYNNGSLYNQATDSLVFTCNSGATVPIGTIATSPQTGTYPSLPHYFQERRGFAGTPNEPDTYFFSKPGNFDNYNVHDPVIDSDSITGTPWVVEINGIQWMIPMPGGDVVLTGLSAWQLTGAGGSALYPQPITPASQQAQPQAYNGVSATVPPLRILSDIIYVQAKGSIVHDLAYTYYINIYTGQDVTVLSSHLFTGYTINEWAYAEEPYKVIWAVRNDGVLLSLSWIKVQEVSAWAHSDTQGLFRTICSVTEPPVDAVYLGVERFIGNNGAPAYTIERMDNRIWSQVEDCWCVDCGLSLAQPEPAATLYPKAPLGKPTTVTGLAGGAGYDAATTATLIDPTGTGCAVTLAINGAGTITGVSFVGGTGYTDPEIVLADPSGQGRNFAATVTLDNSATWTTSAGVFSGGSVGNVIRVGGGKATITTYNSSTSVIVNVTEPVATIPGMVIPAPAAAGEWTMTTPTATITGLKHLAGQTVTGLYDGNVLAPTVVPANGTVTLPAAASNVIIGLGFQAQMQSLYLPDAATQGQRKIIGEVTARIEASRGVKIGTNQPDGAAQSPPQVAVAWSGLEALPDLGKPAYGSAVVPLYTGDVKIQVPGAANKKGQVALQQDNPLPLNVLAIVPLILPGDSPETSVQQSNQQRAA